MTSLWATVVINLSIDENTPTRNHMRSSIRTDGTNPIVLGFGQLRGNPVPSQERDGLVHVSRREGRTSYFCWFHALDYKAISAKWQSVERGGSYSLPGPFPRLFPGWI